MASSFLRFLDHTQRHITVGRIPLDKWSARRRDLYLKTHNTHNRQTSMPPVGFEPTISASERPQTYALDRAATGTGSITPLMLQTHLNLNNDLTSRTNLRNLGALKQRNSISDIEGALMGAHFTAVHAAVYRNNRCLFWEPWTQQNALRGQDEEFLGAFACSWSAFEIRYVHPSVCMSACPFLQTNQRVFQSMDLCQIRYWEFLWKSIKKTQTEQNYRQLHMKT